jgi:hypothetical protein
LPVHLCFLGSDPTTAKALSRVVPEALLARTDKVSE